MILDFVFGGKDYVNKCLYIQENVGEHTVNFTFEYIIFQEAMPITGMYSVAMRIMNRFWKIAR